jgi:hypothetical protein
MVIERLYSPTVAGWSQQKAAGKVEPGNSKVIMIKFMI